MGKRVQEMEEEEMGDEAPVAKKAREFSAKEFRQQLNTAGKIEALKNFLSVCSKENSTQAIQSYLEKGGSCGELIHLLDAGDVPQTIIVDLTNHVLLQVIAKYAQLHTNAYDACRHLVNNHILLINKMLNLSSSGKERTVILKLLTTIVAFSAPLAKEILIHVNFHTTNLELITKNENPDVRNAFVRFIIAFMVDNHYPTISLLLEKKHILTSVVAGLKFDNSESVCLFLTTLKSNVLENPSVSKTTKMKIFSTPVMKDVVNLYNWKGPKGYDPRKKGNLIFDIDEVEKSVVNESVHAFLLTLCTSHKFGVIFKDPHLGLGKKHANGLMYTVLESLERPWEHSYVGELVTKICAACPDLVKTMWANLKPYLEPRLTVKWMNAVTFVKRLLNELEPKCIEFCAKDLSPQQFVQTVQFLVAPTAILKIILTETDSHAIKHEVYKVLESFLVAICRYLTIAKAWFSMEAQRNVKNLLHDHVNRNFPPALTILKKWNVLDEIDEIEELKYTPNDHLGLILNVFHLYLETCPNLLENLNDVEGFLTEIDALDDADFLQIKAIKLFIGSEPELFKIGKESFEKTVSFALRIYHKNCGQSESDNAGVVADLAKVCLNLLFKNTGIFESYEEEINLWINAVLDLKRIDSNLIGFLVRTIEITNERLPQYLEEIAALKDSLNETNSIGHLDDFTEMLENLKDNRFDHSLIKQVYFSPFIIGMFEQLKSAGSVSKYIKQYVQFALNNLFHTQSNFSLINALIKKHIEVINSNYYLFFEDKNEASSLPSLTSGKVNVFRYLIEAVLTQNSQLLIEHEGIETVYIEEFKPLLLKTAVFYMLNLNLTDEVYNTLLDILKFLNYEQNAKIILNNPMLLNKFDVLRMNHPTRFLIELFRSLRTERALSDSDLRPFSGKFLTSLLKEVKKGRTKNLDKLADLMEIFSLGCDEYLDILNVGRKNESEIFKTTSFVRILVYSLSKLNVEASEGLINVLSERLAFLNGENIETSKLAAGLNEYLTKHTNEIKFIPSILFESIVNKTEFCKENANLAILLLKYNEIELFEKNIEKILATKALLLPLLDVLTEKLINEETISKNEALTKKVYESFEPVILKALQKPQKATHFQQNHAGVCFLIKTYLPKSKFSLEKVHKFETSEVFHANMLKVIYEKYTDGKTVNQSVLTFVHLIVGLFKRRGKSDGDWEKLNSIVNIVSNYLIHLKSTNKNLNLEKINENETFKLFCKFSLKFGLSSKGFLLKLLRELIEVVTFSNEEADELMEMIVSHSEFLDVILTEKKVNEGETLPKDDPVNLKYELLLLFNAICKRYTTAMKREHVPVLLGAYGATIDENDRILLQLLRLYESIPGQTNFYDFKPFLWGTTARNHYSLRSDTQKTLWRQPKTGDVLEILNESWIYNTIKQHGVTVSDKNVYDLNFLLPLFSQLLSPENTLQTHRFTKSGALAVSIVSLSSESEEIRKSACYVLSRFYFHLEGKQNGKDNLLWLRLIEAVCKGTSVLKNFKLNNFASIFFAKMALVLTKPQDVMYVPLTQYLGAKSSPDLSTIPELYTLLHSSDVNFREHRSFILEILLEGLRFKSDLDVFLKAMSHKLLMEIFNSVLSDAETKVSILRIFQAACKIKSGSTILCKSFGLLSWLHAGLLSENERVKKESRFVLDFIHDSKEVESTYLHI